MANPMCAVCGVGGLHSEADCFVVRRKWSADFNTFVDDGVCPLCLQCFTRRKEMAGARELPWHEAIHIWNVQQVHEQ